ncbi:MAG: AAA family ATPase [Litorimonas sp.]
MKTLLIAGGSASGKTWLAERIAERLPGAVLLAQDSFYHDRPSGSAEDRHAFDFDQPYSIDWAEMARAMRALQSGRAARVPVYDFTVSLRSGFETVEPDGDVLIVDGTLVLSQPAISALADARLYVRCPEPLRRARRERRDVEDRGRHIDYVRKQLEQQVFPAHNQHVQPSAAHADLVMSALDIVADPDACVKRVLALIEKTG